LAATDMEGLAVKWQGETPPLEWDGVSFLVDGVEGVMGERVFDAWSD